MTETPNAIWLDRDFQPWRVWTIEMNDLPKYVRADTKEMTDRADLIDKLKRWAWSEQQNADDAKRIYPKASEWYANRAALLREAAKALGGE